MKDLEIKTDRFSVWLDQTRRIQKTGEAVNVPCGECTACCRSSYFIHIKSSESGTIANIPEALMFPAPGLPEGNVLLGFDKKGNCPMFRDKRCSIYDYRPETCRTYDCRLFIATGLHPGDDKPLISRQVRRWKFDFYDNADFKNFSAVRAAAKFINEHAGLFPAGFIPGNIPQQAMIAIKVYEAFLNTGGDSEKYLQLNPDNNLIKTIIGIYEKFERDEYN